MDGVDGNIARAGGVSKHAGMVAPPIHGGMTRQTKTGQTALGGDHASAIDSLSGQVVVPGTPKTEPGWGNQTARSGNPLVKPPGSKAQTPFKIAPGMSAKNTVAAKTSDEHAALGAAILAEAKLGVRGRS
ncbi:MAG TPA: hypothetical protein VMQ54_11285 [Steroidobacteraceae bacterium]|nr:hypothetical protein [Steroidobacteraceae bacterium]